MWGSLAVLAAAGNASAQWFPFSSGNSCNCGSSAATMQSASYSSYGTAIHQTAYAGDTAQCGQPISCSIDPPPMTAQVRAIAPVVQTVKVEHMQQVIQPVYNTVHVTEMQAVKQSVQKPVYETQMVNQTVTVMQPVTEQRTAQVPTVEYQTQTEYRQVKKDAGYWATKTEATAKVSPYQYDNRPGFLGWMNRTGYQARTALVPQNKVTRTYVPQTMTCTVPCTKKVAVQGMKQVTYNVTSMVPQQQTRQVAVQTMRMVEQEVTAMQPVTVARTVQVGHRISHVPIGSTSTTAMAPGTSTPVLTPSTTAAQPSTGGSALVPMPDEKASAKRPAIDAPRTATPEDSDFGPDGFNPPKKTSNYYKFKDAERSEMTEMVIPTRPAAKTPSVVRVSQWVAHNPTPTSPELGKPSATMAIAGNGR
jgi:hypothetical protein